MSEKQAVNHYAAVLADLEAQRARIDAAIETIKALQGGAPISIIPSTGSLTVKGGTPEIAVDEFHRLTVSKAIKKFLTMRGKPATTPEIVEALISGGQKGSDGNNFTVVVSNTLNRMQAPDGGISKVKRGVWGLREWYDDKLKKAPADD